jgi:Family of unknown function (DUF6030)
MRMQLFLALCLALVAGAAAAQPARFTEPKAVCKALSGEGFVSGGWRKDDEGFEETNFLAYKCLSEGFIIPGSEGAFVTSLNYFAEGRTVDRVEIVKLVLNIHNRKTRNAGRDKFVQSGKVLLHALGIEPPAAFLAALEQSKAGVFPIEGGRIRYEVWSIPVERQRLTIETDAVLKR